MIRYKIYKEKFVKIRGILFDLDGTLIDTIDLIIQAFEHKFA